MATNVTITGKWSDIFGQVPSGQESIDVTLVNYGTQVPRVSGVSILGDVFQSFTPSAVDGTFSFPLYGNDIILPGPSITYYQFTFKNANGAPVASVLYQFASGSFDLSTVSPFSPGPPPGPPPSPTAVVTNPTGVQTISTFALVVPQLGIGQSNIVTLASTTRTVTLPDASGTVAFLSNNLGAFANTTSAQLRGIITDETGTGALVFANTPTLATPNIGAATGTSLNLSGNVTAATGNVPSLNTNSIFQSAATILKIVDNNSGTRFSIPANGTSQSTLNNTLITGGSTYGGTTQNFQKFSASGTFTIPANVTSVKVTLIGGGGAGGGSTVTNNGGGGGTGGIAIKYLSALTPGNTITVSVGAGGTGVSAATGNAGSASTISSGTQTITTVTAFGGNGGFMVAASSAGGAGAVVSTNGDINGAGSAGGNSLATNVGGGGGSTLFGGDGNPSGGAVGNPAVANTGSGGSGAGAAGNAAGGAGGSGIVIFEWTT